jgi:hypothetical protein
VEKITIKPRNPASTGTSKAEANNAQEMAKFSFRRIGNQRQGSRGGNPPLAGKLDRIFHYHLGPVGEHTAREAELVGILLAMQLAKTETAGRTSFAVGIDHHVALL